MLDGIWKDLLYAIRATHRRPLISVVAVTTLTLGIGANVAIFSLLYSVLLRPLPYPGPDRLVTLWQDHTSRGGPVDEWASWDNFADWREQSETVRSMTAVGGWVPTLTERGAPERLQGITGTADFFEVFGAAPSLGRTFMEEDDRPNAEPVVVLDYRFWQRRFGGDSSVLGTSLRLDGEPFEVIGVMPEGFAPPFTSQVDLYRPLRVDAATSCGRGCVTQRVVGRLTEKTTVEQARSELQAVAAQLAQQFPESNADIGMTVIPLHERVTFQARAPLTLLLLAVGLVLLIACANVANLQLARASGREDEISLRMAIGASRSRLIRQLTTEAMWLALLGGIAGVVVARGLVSLFRVSLAGLVPRAVDASVNAPVLLFALALSVITGLVFGLAPAIRASSLQLTKTIKEASGSRGGRRFRSILVASEVALALILLVGAGLMTRSLMAIIDQDLGYDPTDIVVARVSLPQNDYPTPESRRAFTASVLERLRSSGDVRFASHTMAPPLSSNNADSNFLVEGDPPYESGREPVAWLRSVDPDFFKTLRVPVTQGRALTDADHADASLVLVVNQALVDKYWPGEDPIGKRVSFNRPMRWREVVGVVGDTRHFGLTEPARPAAYFPYAQLPIGSVNFLVRTERDPESFGTLLAQFVHESDPHLAVGAVAPLTQSVTNSRSLERFVVILLSGFSLTALLLAAIGLYGVLSYSVGQRQRELGIRMALGADGSSIRRMVLSEGLKLTGIGGALGLIASLFLVRGLASQLFGVNPYDAWTLSVVPIILFVAASLACAIPALRASRLDLVRTLRSD